MTDLREKLAGLLIRTARDDRHHGTFSEDITQADLTMLADAIIAALPDMVPDLVWDDNDRSLTAVGCYKVLLNTYSKARPFWFLFLDSQKRLDLGEWRHLSEAKAAANTHHRAQIMAALGVT